MYFTAVMQTIFFNHETRQIDFASDQEHWSAGTMMFVVGNGSREGGGFLVTPDAKVDDGLLHYATINKVSRPMMLRLVPEVMNGTHGKFPQVRMGSFRQIALKADGTLRIHLDGEVYAGFGSNVTELTIEVVPQAIEFQF
jgi:diacylglycerol kinase family enzyme